MLAIATLPALLAPGSASAAQFPPMRVETLSGLPLDLPDQLAAGPSIVVLVYDQSQQPEADSWEPFLAGLAAIDPAARAYLMPLLPAGLSMVRGMVEGVIRASARDAADLDRTILLFTDVNAVQTALSLSGTGAIHVVLLDDAGAVTAAVAGAYSIAKAERLGKALAPAAPDSERPGPPQCFTRYEPRR